MSKSTPSSLPTSEGSSPTKRLPPKTSTEAKRPETSPLPPTSKPNLPGHPAPPASLHTSEPAPKAQTEKLSKPLVSSVESANLEESEAHDLEAHPPLASDIQALLQGSALWDVRSEKERELLKVVVSQYGLDPLTREVMILDGHVYVTASGVQRLAVRDPLYDGCEIEIVQADWVKNFFVVKARVWKKHCEHPFEDYGDANPSTSKMRGHALFRHAITRARSRAMRSAFAIPFCTLEELDDEARSQMFSRRRDRPSEASTSPAPSTPAEQSLAFLKASADAPTSHAPAAAAMPASDVQIQAIQRMQREIGLSDEELASDILPSLHLTSLDQLNRSQASRLLDHLDSRLAQADPARPPHDPAAQEIQQALLSALSLDQLRNAWNLFQRRKAELPDVWIQRLCHVKDQRKKELEG